MNFAWIFCCPIFCEQFSNEIKEHKIHAKFTQNSRKIHAEFTQNSRTIHAEIHAAIHAQIHAKSTQTFRHSPEAAQNDTVAKGL